MKKKGQTAELIANINKALEDDPENKILLSKKEELEESLKRNKFNAVKKEYNGKTYDSKREALMARCLDEAGLLYAEQVTFEVIPQLKFDGKTVARTSIKIDFVIEGMYIVDVKGTVLPQFWIKFKMLMHSAGEDFEYYMPKTDKEVIDLVAKFVKNKEEYA